MVPGGSPAFLNPDGTVRGVPSPASSDVPAAPAAYVPRSRYPWHPDPSPRLPMSLRPPVPVAPVPARPAARTVPALPRPPAGGTPRQVR
ncbi:hypothetical protein GCM10020000_59710 [Streptomyces olivoverticillatus]